jgi:hypothetical protein
MARREAAERLEWRLKDSEADRARLAADLEAAKSDRREALAKVRAFSPCLRLCVQPVRLW